MKYNGNEEEFRKLNNKLEEKYNYEIEYYDKEKTKKKYKGEIKNGKYNGRGILK